MLIVSDTTVGWGIVGAIASWVSEVVIPGVGLSGRANGVTVTVTPSDPLPHPAITSKSNDAKKKHLTRCILSSANKPEQENCNIKQRHQRHKWLISPFCMAIFKTLLTFTLDKAVRFVYLNFFLLIFYSGIQGNHTAIYSFALQIKRK